VIGGVTASLPPAVSTDDRSIGDHVPAGRLVSSTITASRVRASISQRLGGESRPLAPGGHTIPSPEWVTTLERLPSEGLYRVRDVHMLRETMPS
jgi:hypothetical protein